MPALVTVPDPGHAKAQGTAAEVASRKYYRDQQALVKDTRSTGRFLKSTKSLRETGLSGKASRFSATAKDVGKLGRLVVLLRQEFSSAGLDVTCFDLADMSKEVLECVINKLFVVQ
ncbi:hypothetical protein CYMTET_40534 [Cymbomonas tetramitiformis]|uniref:Uncharacterized protein n=1 Tax=Cymbomonas tetramitiformis TaxID=36881 RepID=A0AAE0F3J6_9CHLO|nr:hypothetical protein CYMTET_40534 [Cymbomonas tetramitiformis]